MHDTFFFLSHFSQIYAVFEFILIFTCFHDKTFFAYHIIFSESLKLNSGRIPVNVAQSSKFITALIFPDTQLNVLSYNRCVRYWKEGLTPALLLEKISSVFQVTQLPRSATTSLQNCSSSPSGVDLTMSPAAPSSAPTSGTASSGGTTSTATTATCDPSSINISLASCSLNPPAAEYSESAVSEQRSEVHKHNITMYVDHCWYQLKPLMITQDELESNPLCGVDCQVSSSIGKRFRCTSEIISETKYVLCACSSVLGVIGSPSVPDPKP